MGGADRRIVVITGAAGAMGSLLVDRLADRWQIRAVDLVARPGIAVRDITDPDSCRETFAGADAVVHLAADPEPEATWGELRSPNVEGAHTVASVAAECGIRRLVIASSLQAVSGFAPGRQRRAGDPPRPANLYGATKAWAEALGSWVSSVSATSVIALRIGFFLPAPPTGVDATPSNLSAWLSHGDCVRLATAAVESPRTGFLVVNGISANRHRYAELGDAEQSIGYAPQDDAWTWASLDGG